jgi:hypothetical protein
MKVIFIFVGQEQMTPEECECTAEGTENAIESY